MPAYDPIRDKLRLSKQVDLVAKEERKLLTSLVGTDIFSLLDVGCAQGELSVARIEPLRCIEFVGIDPSKTAIKVASAFFPDYEWVQGSLPAGLGEFDIVWSSRVVHHVQGPDAFLQACWDRVRPGGKLVIVFPDDRHNVAAPATALLQWMLDGDLEVTDPSGRRMSERIFATALRLTSDVEVHTLPLATGLATPELVDVVFDWRLDALEVGQHVIRDACVDEVARFREIAERGHALLLCLDTALVLSKPNLL